MSKPARGLVGVSLRRTRSPGSRQMAARRRACDAPSSLSDSVLASLYMVVAATTQLLTMRPAGQDI